MPDALTEEIFGDVEPIIKGMGFDLVELRSMKTKNGAQVYAVVYRSSGVDLDSCSDILKTIRPRIQMIAGNPDVHIEVSSPGMERVLKDKREFGIFLGRGIRVLARDRADWIGGVVAGVSGDGLHLDTGKEKVFLSYADIKKAKLDYTQEVR